MGIKENVAKRVKANELIELIDSEVDEGDRIDVYKLIVCELGERVGLEEGTYENPDEVGMAYEDARRFGEREMPRGKHEGDTIINIAPDYLCYVVQPDPFWRDLGRYVNSTYFRDVHEPAHES